jgi:hypothetical protein
MSDFVKYVCCLPSVPLGTTGKTLKKGETLEFNGVDIRVGAEVFRLPQLQSAIREKWFVEYQESSATPDVETPSQRGIRKVRNAEVDWQNPNQRSEIEVEQFYAEERSVGQVVESADRDLQTQSSFQKDVDQKEKENVGELNLKFDRGNVEVLSDSAPSIGKVQAPPSKEAAKVVSTTAPTDVAPSVDGNRLEPSRKLAPIHEQFVVEK